MIKVRSGVQASEDKIEYSITTTMAKEYLQSKFNLLATTAKKKGMNIPEINIMMYNEKLGKNFIPFFLILPEDVLIRNKETEDIPSIFKSENSDHARLFGPYYEMLRAYTFNKDDKRAFRSTDWKRRAGIQSGKNIGTLLKYSTPKIENFGNGGRKVIVLIDPIRLFHDMLTDDSARKQNFEVLIEHWKEIDSATGNWNFVVNRKVLRNKSENDDAIYAKMLRRINGQ